MAWRARIVDPVVGGIKLHLPKAEGNGVRIVFYDPRALGHRGGEPAVASYGRRTEDGVYNTSRSPIPY